MKLNLSPKILLIGAGLTLVGPIPGFINGLTLVGLIPGFINLFLQDTLSLNESFYIFFSTAICLSAAFGTYYLFQNKDRLWIVFALMAVFFNPIAPVLTHGSVFWHVFTFFIATLIFLYAFNLHSESKVTKRIFYYAGKMILAMGLCFTGYLFIIGLPHLNINDSQDFNPAAVIIIIASLGMTLTFTIFWNQLFLKKSDIWIPRLEE